MSNKKWKYFVSAIWTDKKLGDMSYQTQLYMIGIYLAINAKNDMITQRTPSPYQMMRFCKELKKQEELGDITNLEFGREIIVTKDEDGLFKEVL
jgi:hypothetical protein